jgi:recombinase-like zinc beta ribbon protein
MPWAMAVGVDVDERFLVRDLVRCGPCGLGMSALVMSPGRRFYGCRNIHCPRPVISAEMLETLVWQAFLYLFADTDVELSSMDQRAAFVHSLQRVTVGVDLGDVRYQWRDQP